MSNRFLTFTVGAQLYALRAEQVVEVIRVPALARVPQGPPALLGIANLRGAVLPVAGLRELLGLEPQRGSDARAIVLDIGAPVALVVDAVASLASATEEEVQSRHKEVSAEGAEVLLGAFAAGGHQVAKILDINSLLAAAFTQRARPPATGPRSTAARRAQAAQPGGGAQMLVTFEVAGQEFALPLEAVAEILQAPAQVTRLARADAVVLGMTSLRGTLLPLLSLRRLLGFGASDGNAVREKVVVVHIGGAQVGLVADRARSIVAASAELVDPVPPVLAARTGGESRVRSVYRGDGGQRLVSILAPEQLFKDEVMQRLTGGTAQTQVQDTEMSATPAAEQIFLVFRLGDDEFGLPIDTVVEVAQVPAQITRVPRTPKFLEGVVNLRGELLPVIDQRRRFEMPALPDGAARRMVVIRTAHHRAGVIVDSVTDVLRSSASEIEPPPELTDATSRLIRGVINLARSGRMVLVLDPAELLTRAEQGLLDTFQVRQRKDGA
ncbi:MAG: chemotaxis protein CheW [Steroidobacteraceae bacterium]